jgi:hypothetical protein
MEITTYYMPSYPLLLLTPYLTLPITDYRLPLPSPKYLGAGLSDNTITFLQVYTASQGGIQLDR